ncbi:MAG: hypothetical protein HY207_10255 [Nitrospirae bacterium]|nr:hypothetical protein [Nitrospirota bacterium]
MALENFQIGRGRCGCTEADLKAAIAERVNGPLEDLKKQLAGFGGLGEELASRSDALSGILSGTKLAPKGLKLPF